MRLSVLVLLAGGALLTASAAAAQMTMPMLSNMPRQATYGGDTVGVAPVSAQLRYQERLAMLRKKLLKVTAEDGGQLSEAHKAALQQELDSINRELAANTATPRPFGGR
jgi:hypothetical protein